MIDENKPISKILQTLFGQATGIEDDTRILGMKAWAAKILHENAKLSVDKETGMPRNFVEDCVIADLGNLFVMRKDFPGGDKEYLQRAEQLLIDYLSLNTSFFMFLMESCATAADKQFVEWRKKHGD